MAHDVYICYSSNDKSTADAMCATLENEGVGCWIAPRDIRPGESWGGALIKAIRDSRVMILVFSGNANASPQIKREVERAVHFGTTVIPVRIENVLPDDELEYFLGMPHWLDAFDDFPTALGLLLRTVKELLGTPSTKVQAATPPPLPPSAVSPASATLSFPSSLLGDTTRILIAVPKAREEEKNLEAARARVLTEELSVFRFEDFRSYEIPSAALALLGAHSEGLLGPFERVLQLAGQSLSVQDPGRRVETLESALRTLSSLQARLLDNPGSISSAILQATSQWSVLFQEERTKAEKALEEAQDLENPFIVGNPVNTLASSLFTGRHDLALEIERCILGAVRTPTLLLYGQRRMGKTSILNQLPVLLGPTFLPVLMDCQAPSLVESQAALLRNLTRCLVNALNQRLGIAYDDVNEQKARGVTPLPLDVLREDGYSAMEDWLDVFQSRLPPDCRVLLCLDEFERLQQTLTTDWGGRFLDALRHWLQHRPSFALMFIGSHTFEQLGPLWTERFLNARRLKVSFLHDEDVLRLLTKPTPTFRMTYTEDALAAMLTTTHGQPFLTQALASELVNHMNSAKRRQATVADVTHATGEALERSGDYFADLWGSRTEAEKAMLCEIAQGKLHPPVEPVARELYEYDVLNKEGAFAVPMVKQWVRKEKLHLTSL